MLPSFLFNVGVTFLSYLLNNAVVTCSKVFTMKDPIIKKTVLAVAFSVLFTAIIPLLLFAMPAETAAHKNLIADSLFINITFMGDALFSFALVFFLLFFLNRKDLSLRLLLTLAVSLLLVQFVKNVFSGQPMHLYFEAGNPGDALYKNLLSSHTAVAFTLAGFFAMYAKNLVLHTSLFIFAFIIAYSRIYFGESFFAVAMGLIPAMASLLFANYIKYSKRVKSGYRRRGEKKISPQHLFPA